jgi:hypothetical protein
MRNIVNKNFIVSLSVGIPCYNMLSIAIAVTKVAKKIIHPCRIQYKIVTLPQFCRLNYPGITENRMSGLIRFKSKLKVAL